MIDRIQEILQKKGLSASQFADQINAQRANVSHILTGRNKPSLDFITKILTSYPDINSDWLLFGKGKMETSDISNNDSILNAEEPIFGSMSNNSIQKSNQKDYKKIPGKSSEEKETDKVKLAKPTLREKQVIKVVILYSDHSFEEFNPF